MSIIKKSEVKMTSGNIARLLVMFSVPLIIGNLFQQLYNMVDTWVVGNYVSDNAFSAVGTVGPILNIFIFTITGFANGGGVVVSQLFGAGDTAKVKKAVNTMVVIAVVTSAVFTIAGYLSVPFMLRFMKSPAGVYEEQLAYLHIIFAFLSFQIIYNIGAALLRAIGDSARPFIFLVVACITNIVLDLVFVLKFNMGVRGVAWATIIAQGVSATMCVITLLTTDACIKVVPKDVRFDGKIARKIFSLGLPTALQSMVTAFSNVFVQGYINAFGADIMGGWTCYSKVDQIIVLPIQSVCIGAQTFVGQNLGAGDEKRAKKGMWTACGVCMAMTAVLVAAVMIAAPAVSGFFTDSEEIIKYGTYFIRTISPFIFVSCISMVTLSSLRGAGNSTMAMIFTLFSYVLFRQIYLFAASRIWPGELNVVAFAYPIGWILCMLLVMGYFLRFGFGKRSSVAQTLGK